MSKYKPGDVVVVTSVPARAQPAVEEGMPAHVVPFNSEGEAMSAREIGLVLVKIGFFTYWWAEKDLGWSQ